MPGHHTRRRLMRRGGRRKGAGQPPSRPDEVRRDAGDRRRIRPLLRVSWWRGRIRELTAWQKGFHARVETRFPVITGLVDRMVSVNIFDSATRIAAQCFLTAVPLLFVVGAYAPTAVRDQVSTSVSAVFGLTGQARNEVRQAFRLGTPTSPPDETEQA